MTLLVLLVIVVLVLLLLAGEPLFVVLGAAALLCFALLSPEVHRALDMLDIVGKFGELADKEILLAIPFFVIAGAIMTRGQISTKLIEVTKALVGWLPGGLAAAAVLGCMLFAAISGSSPATIIAIGSVMVPALLKEQYPENFSVGLVTTAGSLGILIPPSIPMLVYALVKTSGEPIDVGDLFLAGVGPGLLIGVMLIGYAMASGRRFGLVRDRFSLPRLGRACRDGFWSLMLPVIILGGIYSGLFTETEAAAVAVVYAWVVETFIHRELKTKALVEVLADSARLMGTLLLVMVMAMALNDYLTDQKVPEAAVGWLVARDLGPVALLLMINLVLLIAGCFMDSLSAIVILVPLLAPVAESLGIKPIHLAILVIVNLELGYMTPPIGLNLFVSSSLFHLSLGRVARAVLPTMLILAAGVAIVTFVPTVQLGLVNLVQGRPFYEPFPTRGAVVRPVATARRKGAAPGPDQAAGAAVEPGRVAPATQGRQPSIADLTDAADQGLRGAPGRTPSIADLTDAADQGLRGAPGRTPGGADGPAAADQQPRGPAPGRAPSIADHTEAADKALGPASQPASAPAPRSPAATEER